MIYIDNDETKESDTAIMGIRQLISKMRYAVGAGVLNVLTSTVFALFVPKYFGDNITQYGYLQAFLLYASYLGILALGWLDGVYLVNGGRKYAALDHSTCASQFWLITCWSFLISITICVMAHLYVKNSEMRYIYSMLGVQLPITLARGMLLCYLQATNRVKASSTIISLGRVSYLLFVVIVLAYCHVNYKLLILCNIAGCCVELGAAIKCCPELVFAKPAGFLKGISTAIEHIKAGISLMIANIASTLTASIVRFVIQAHWSVEIFGKTSLAFTISNFLPILINAAALALYPAMRNADPSKCRQSYRLLSDIIALFSTAILLLYSTAMYAFTKYLPQYSDGVKYLVFLLPANMLIAQTLMVSQTYMQLFHIEKKLMKINVGTAIIVLLSSVVCAYLVNSLSLTIATILISQIVRYIYIEHMLVSIENIGSLKSAIEESSVFAAFSICFYFLPSGKAQLLYGLIYVVYLIAKKNDIASIVNTLKAIRQSAA